MKIKQVILLRKLFKKVQSTLKRNQEKIKTNIIYKTFTKFNAAIQLSYEKRTETGLLVGNNIENNKIRKLIFVEGFGNIKFVSQQIKMSETNKYLLRFYNFIGTL